MGWFTNQDKTWGEMEASLSGHASTPSGRLRDVPTEHDVPFSRKRAVYEPVPVLRPSRPITPYAELHAHSSFSWLDGASSPKEMVEQAVRLGLTALSITDHDGLYAAPQFAEAAERWELLTVFGAELSIDPAPARTRTARMTGARTGMPDPPGRHLVMLARDEHGYGPLCSVISEAQIRGGVKGRPRYDDGEIDAAVQNGHLLVLTGGRKGPLSAALGDGTTGTFGLDAARGARDELITRFGADNLVVELTYSVEPLADARLDALHQLATEAGLSFAATSGAHYHASERQRLASVMAATRARSTLPEMAGWLPPDRSMRSGEEMAARFARWPGAVEQAARLGSELAFPLTLIRPDLPPFDMPEDFTDEMSYLRHLTYEGFEKRYAGKPELRDKARKMIDHELAIIENLNFPGYFLVVWDIARFCRQNGILCQGRGSAANSAVCYVLEVTAVDAVEYDLLFERFLSADRQDEAPDIDIDIESDQREKVIQYVYEKHGRRNAAQVANVITYRPRSAVRDVARTLGYSTGQQDAWAKQVDRHSWQVGSDQETGSDDPDEIPSLVIELARELTNTPRHLGIHSGGMVMCDRPVTEVCPVEWGRMENRTVLQWDKDDCEYAGLVKFDLLGLGMLSVLRYAFDFVEESYKETLDLYKIPADDPKVYDMLCVADTVGVFQIESRAQMSTLPRLKPRTFNDLVIEIALIRPGPIQGGAVHPYLRRRDGKEPPDPPHPMLKDILKKTLGVPLFQEQLMRIAVVAGGFTADEANKLRRAMGSKRSDEKMVELKQQLYDGMAKNGITGEIADDIYKKISSFAAYGFPESHSISFAFLANASSWLKLYYPDAFLAALLNAQPMGFYSPQSLVHDARRHNVIVRGPHINASGARSALEAKDTELQRYFPVRLGLSQVRSIGIDVAERIVAERERGPYLSMTHLTGRLDLTTEQVEALATAGAFDDFGLGRREALWQAAVAASRSPGQFDAPVEYPPPMLPEMSVDDQLVADLWSTGISRDHPIALVREHLDALGVVSAGGLREVDDRVLVRVAGVVTHRQRPSSASGITFMSLEDETGVVNVVCHPAVWDRHSRVARDSGALLIRGQVERTGEVINVIARQIARLPLGVKTRSRDFQ